MNYLYTFSWNGIVHHQIFYDEKPTKRQVADCGQLIASRPLTNEENGLTLSEIISAPKETVMV